MRPIRYGAFLLLVSSWLTSVATNRDGMDVAIADETEKILSSLSENALANHFVWARGEWSQVNPNWIAEDLIGGIVLNQAATLDQVPKHLSIALMLDEQLQISFEQTLTPDAATIAAIQNETLKNQYFDWLRESAKYLGYDYLISSDNQPDYFSALFNEMHAFDTAFFIYPHQLKQNPDNRRKKFYENTGHELAQIIPLDEFESYEKLLAKGPKKTTPNPQRVREQLYQLVANSHTNPFNHKKEKALLDKIWKQSIVPLQKNEGVFPLMADTVAIWTSSSLFIEQLDIYFNTVQNTRFDHIKSHIPVIIDARHSPMLAMEKALELNEHPIIWIGELDLLMGIQPIGLLMTNSTHQSLDHILPEMIYGSEPIRGKLIRTLPVHLATYYHYPISKQQLLGFSQPEWLHMDAMTLDSINLLAQEMISEYGSPGGQVLVVKEGKVVFEKNYGYLTYDSLIPVQSHTLYDLASLTKVTATLLATMKLHQEGLLQLDSTLGFYLTSFKETNKSNITIRQLLAHQSGLKSYLPFWKRSLDGDFVDAFYYKSDEDEKNDHRSYGYQPDPAMLDSLLGWIQNSPLNTEEEVPYVYSDIGFMILHQVIESISGTSMDIFLENNFYQPLGMYSTCFNPLVKGFELYEIAPTEYDYYFRDEQVWGQVHDRNAAVFGGVAGHAGLFSNARDLALLMQMLMQEGNYRSHQFIDPLTLHSFNQQYFSGNRRGLGWDKPGAYNPNISDHASSHSYGHTGFTGTMVWADPEQELIFVFLSNRIFPDANNKNLIRLDTRKKMHNLVYRSLLSP